MIMAVNSMIFADVCRAEGLCSHHSPPHTVALVELYTSEGCSSCPPADRALSSLMRTQTSAQQRFLPMALHVDYWDGLGWKDSFGDHSYSRRQSWLSALGGSRSVYTPEYFVGGHELRQWSAAMEQTIARINQVPARADIALTQLQGQDITLEVEVKSSRRATIATALLENNLVTQVSAGENQGARLQHDAVVRNWRELPQAAVPEQTVRQRVTLTPPVGSRRSALSVAVLVQDERGEVLQATSMPLCP